MAFFNVKGDGNGRGRASREEYLNPFQARRQQIAPVQAQRPAQPDNGGERGVLKPGTVNLDMSEVSNGGDSEDAEFESY